MAILLKECKLDNFEPQNSLKRNWQILEAFVQILLKSNSPEILALCDTNFDDSIASGNFSVRCYLTLIEKDSTTHMHGLAVYVKEGLPFALDLSLENSAYSYFCFWLRLLHSVSYFFSLYWSLSFFLCTFFDFISSNIDEVLSINPSQPIMYIIRTGLPILVELIDLVNSVITFLSQMTLLR